MRARYHWGSFCCFDCLDYLDRFISLEHLISKTKLHLLPPLPFPAWWSSWGQWVPGLPSFSEETLYWFSWSTHLGLPFWSLYVTGTAMWVPLLGSDPLFPGRPTLGSRPRRGYFGYLSLHQDGHLVSLVGARVGVLVLSSPPLFHISWCILQIWGFWGWTQVYFSYFVMKEMECWKYFLVRWWQKPGLKPSLLLTLWRTGWRRGWWVMSSYLQTANRVTWKERGHENVNWELYGVPLSLWLEAD